MPRVCYICSLHDLSPSTDDAVPGFVIAAGLARQSGVGWDDADAVSIRKSGCRKQCARGISSHRNIAHPLAYTPRCVQELDGSMKNGPLQSPGLGLGAGFEEGEVCQGRSD